MTAARKLARKLERAARRTQRGLCSNCGRPIEAHSGLPDLLCPDDTGRCYAWTLDREGHQRAIRKLEEYQRKCEEGQRTRAALSEDARVLLDELAKMMDPDEMALLTMMAVAGADGQERASDTPAGTTGAIAARLGWSFNRVRLAALELEEAGMIQSKRMGPAN